MTLSDLREELKLRRRALKGEFERPHMVEERSSGARAATSQNDPKRTTEAIVRKSQLLA
jgi:hypothetical protein